MDMVTVECNCKHCQAYATSKGIEVPMRAQVNSRMHAAVCGTAKGRHNMVQKAYQPPFGRMDTMQAKFGPFPVEAAPLAHDDQIEFRHANGTWRRARVVSASATAVCFRTPDGAPGIADPSDVRRYVREAN